MKRQTEDKSSERFVWKATAGRRKTHMFDNLVKLKHFNGRKRKK